MELARYCLVQRDGSNKPATLRMHRTVRSDLLRRLTLNPERCQEAFFQTFYWIRAVVPHLAPSFQFDCELPVFEIYLPHILCLYEFHVHWDQTYVEEKDNLEFVGLLFDVGLYLLASASFSDSLLAEKLQREGLDSRISMLGQEGLEKVTSVANVSSTYQQKRWTEAEKLLMQVLKTRSKSLGPEHSDTLSSMSNLALIYQNQARLYEAGELQMKVMNMRLKLLGPEHSDTLSSMSNLALIYRDQARLYEAEKLQMKVMNMRSKSLGLKHSDTLSSVSNLALIYQKQGKWKLAEELQIKVMNTRSKSLRSKDTDTLNSMSHILSDINISRSSPDLTKPKSYQDNMNMQSRV